MHCRPHRSPAARVCSSCEGGSILQRLRASGDDSYKRSASTPAQNKRGSYPLRTIYLSRLPATLVPVNNTQASYAHVTQQNEAPRKCTLESSSASRCRTVPPPQRTSHANFGGFKTPTSLIISSLAPSPTSSWFLHTCLPNRLPSSHKRKSRADREGATPVEREKHRRD